ncbi:hypothetical protein Tco_1125149 [Tanacetum coccineum]|uniref:Uncharacterized protein n=1 Tax=Tanacetum coccineum TaxID=301880 RepID=A0ABQ5J8N5_9ASTR
MRTIQKVFGKKGIKVFRFLSRHGRWIYKCQRFFGSFSESAFFNKWKPVTDKCPLETPLDFEEGVFDDEVEKNEVIPISDEEIALDASSEGTMSPGGPRYDYMLSSEAEDDYLLAKTS